MASQQQETSKTWGSRLSVGVKDAILDLILDESNYSPSQIFEKLTEQAKEHKEETGKRKFAALPSLSAIERGVRVHRPRIKEDGEDSWRAVNEEDPKDARIILDIYGEVISRRIDEGGKTATLTNKFAEWILLAYKLAPGLELYGVYLLARLMYMRDVGNWDSEPLDIFLAMAPWTSYKVRGKYQQAVEDGLLPRAPQIDRLMLEIFRKDRAELEELEAIDRSRSDPFPERADEVSTEKDLENHSEGEA